MKQTTAPQATPSPGPKQAKPQLVDGSSNPSSVFINMALDMSWRLAVVVIVPIVGGYELDQRLHSSPWLTIAGFVVAGVGMAAVLRRMLNEVNTRATPKSEKRP